MTEVDLSRSTRFVSLDTHPAHNSLVVTYEILLIVRDRVNGAEICRRSKRDQFQINISRLDHQSDDTKLNAASLNVQQLSEQILAKCQMLNAANRYDILEEIQLNLLYLLNRKQTQANHPNRPPSSASQRIKSNTPSSAGRLAQSQTCRSGSATRSQTAKDDQKSNLVEDPLEVYQSSREKELEKAKSEDFLDYERLDSFVEQLDAHLMEREDELELDRMPKSHLEDLETQLENLYGEQEERRIAMAVIRRFVRDNEKLVRVSSNRLLVCAILRILRDSGDTSKDCSLSVSILYCLIRFTTFGDVFSAMTFGESVASDDNESLDLVRVIIDLLEDHSKWLTANCENDLRLLTGKSYYTNALLVVLANILRMDLDDVSSGNGHRIKQKIIKQHGSKLVNILLSCFALSAKHLARDIRASSKGSERLTVTLMEILNITRQFSILKEFIKLVRAASKIQSLVDSLVVILNVLQLSRPGSGSNQLQQVPINDHSTLLNLYELEIELLMLINNLIYDTRFRARFTRKSLLLKCVLRSLVVFLAANRKTKSIHPFNKSSVLIAPLKCLYELSCSDKIKRELFESRLVMKCLFDYLLNSARHLRTQLSTFENVEEKVTSSGGSNSRLAIAELDLNDCDQIVIGNPDATLYIVSLWTNLSSKPEAPFYKQEEGDYAESLKDYIETAISNLETFTRLVSGQRISDNAIPSLRELHLVIYVHTKLLRNLSQYLTRASECFPEQVTLLVKALAELEQQIQMGTFLPLLVDSLATLSNVLETMSEEAIKNQQTNLESIMNLLFDSRRPLIDGSPSADIDKDDLLLIAFNFLSTFAASAEICSHLDSIHDRLLQTINLTLELRTADNEMMTSCLFTVNQLINHKTFLQILGSSFEDVAEEEMCKQAAFRLVELLSFLMSHTERRVVELADEILNKLKQFEESQSLADSITCKTRFVTYNNKWLNAIKTSREDPVYANDVADLEMTSQAHHLDESSTIDDEDELDLDEYRQLRTINADDTRTWSRLTSTSSVSRASSRFVGAKEDRLMNEDEMADEDEEEGDEEEEVDDEEDEDTSSEPDVNVIDSMSMINHLTSRRTLRGDLTRRVQ